MVWISNRFLSITDHMPGRNQNWYIYFFEFQAKDINFENIFYISPPPPPSCQPYVGGRGPHTGSALATSCRKIINWYKARLWYCFSIHLSSTNGGALANNIRCSGPVSFPFFAMFALKMKLFWSSYKIKKEWSYNLTPKPYF